GAWLTFEVNHIETSAPGMDGLGYTGPSRVGPTSEMKACCDEGGLDLPGGDIGMKDTQIDVGISGEKSAVTRHAQQGAVGQERMGSGQGGQSTERVIQADGEHGHMGM